MLLAEGEKNPVNLVNPACPMESFFPIPSGSKKIKSSDASGLNSGQSDQKRNVKKRRLKYGKNRNGFSSLKKIGQDQQDHRDRTASGRKGSSPKAKKILLILPAQWNLFFPFHRGLKKIKSNPFLHAIFSLGGKQILCPLR
jgi:hypothetical protein